MRVSFNTTNAQAGTNVQGRINKPMEMDSVSKSIHNQISNAQKQLQELSENKDMSMEEKMKRRQEIQQQITDLNNQLRQHQIEQRKEKQEQAAKNAAKKESVKDENKGAGLSQASMTAIISADAALSQAKVHGSVATRMEGRAGVLEAEIKLDLGAKQKELAEVQQKAVAAGVSQNNTLASMNKELESPAKTDKKETKADKKDDVSDDQQNKKTLDEGTVFLEEAVGDERTEVVEAVDVPVTRRVIYSHVDVRL